MTYEDAGRPVGRERGSARLVTMWAAVVAAVSLIVAPFVAAIVAISGGWTPVGDWATITVLSNNSVSTHPPLVGMPTTLSTYSHTPVHHPGPLMFWMLALPVHLMGAPGYGALIGAALVSSLAIAAILTVGWRRGREAGLLASAVVLTMFIHGIGLWMTRDPYNPISALLPAIAFVLLCWAGLDGDRWAWPFAMFFGSYAAQAHITFTPIVAGVLLAATIWMIMRGVRHKDVRRPGRSAKVVVTSIVVGLLCWSGPINDQFRWSGNLGMLISGRTTVGETVGWAASTSRLVDLAIAVIPTWMHPTRLTDTPPAVTSAWRPVMVALVFGGAVLIMVVAMWRRDRRTLTLGALAIASCVSSAYVSSILPAEVIPFASSSNINELHMRATGAVLWTFLLFGSASLLRPVWANVSRRKPLGRIPVGACAAIGVLVTMSFLGRGAATTMPARYDMASAQFDPVRLFAKKARAMGRGSEAIYVDGDASASAFIVAGLVAQLELDDVPVHVDQHMINTLGIALWSPGNEKVRLRVVTGNRLPPPGYRKVMVYDGHHPSRRYAGYQDSIFGSFTYFTLYKWDPPKG